MITIQIILGILIIACILLQTQDAGLGLWGSGGENYSTKRGLEKVIFYVYEVAILKRIFYVTIIAVVGFVLLSLLSLTTS